MFTHDADRSKRQAAPASLFKCPLMLRVFYHIEAGIKKAEGVDCFQQIPLKEIFRVTLIASIYGMNFKSMPELSWNFGYPLAILLIVGSSLLALFLFKRKKWL